MRGAPARAARRIDTRIGDAARAFGATLRQRDLRRAQGAFAMAWAAEWAFTVALGVVAFREGGAAAVGAVGLLRMLPSALLAPFAASLADRMRRERILVWGSVGRAAATGAAAALLTIDGPIAGVYALAVVSTIAVTPFRAAHSALLPSLCRTTEELTSSNVVRGMLDSMSMLVGPAVAAALIGLTSVEAVFMVAAAAALAGALLLMRLEYEPPPREGPPPRLRVWQDTMEGVRAVADHRDAALMIGLATMQTFVRGCLNVFLVVVAIDLLGMGEAGVGVLTAAIGVGAIAGSLAASVLVGGSRMARSLGMAVALWGAPLALIGAIPEQATALIALAAIGVSNAFVDVALFTGIARSVPDLVLARVYGMLESLIALTVGLGSILTPLLIDALGLRGALLLVGALAPAAAAAAWARLRVMDRQLFVRSLEVRLLQMVPFLRPLPMASIEHLARAAHRISLRPDEVVFQEGDRGDAFYVVCDGRVELQHDGETRVLLGRGEAFGEIALLRGLPRTLTAVARSDTTLYVLDAGAFVSAVAGYSVSARTADEIVRGRLEADQRQPV